MTEFLTEQPIVSEEGPRRIAFDTEQPIVPEEGPRRELARQVADWICTQPIAASQSSPAPRGHVAGIYGSRGSGKTSFLFTLLEELRARRGSALVLPTAEGESLPRAIFKPSETRAQDGLLLMLLEHLSEQYPQRPDVDADRGSQIMKDIKEADVLTKETKPFLEYAKEVSPSDDRLVHRYIEVLTKAATTTVRIRSEFSELLKLRASGQERLVFFIDDVDLQPHRALELLELVYLFLDRPGIFVVLAADKPLLLQAVDEELRRRHMHRPGLGGALLAKYVPYGWPLPVIGEVEGLHMLSLSPPWWGGAAGAILDFASRERDTRRLRYSEHDDPDDTKWPPREPGVVSMVQALRWFLPETHRAVKAVRNAIVAIERSLGSRTGGDLSKSIVEKYSYAGLQRELVPQFLLLLVMVDLRWPELQLFASFEKSTAEVSYRLLSLYEIAPMSLAPDRVHERALRSLGIGDPVLFENDVPLALFRLGEVLYSWSRLNAEAAVAELSLFITFFGNADALGRFRALRPEALTDRQVHLDLRSFAPSGKPDSGEQVRRAVAHAMEQLPELIGTTGRLWLGADAPSSFLAWLGFWLDYRRPVVAVNAKTLAAVEVPGRLDPPDRGQLYTPCTREWVGDVSGSKDACVIFDFFGRSVPDDATKLAAARGASEAALCCRLLYSGGSDFNFGDVEAILLDVLELLTELRQRGVSTLHVGMVMPDVVALALGRQLKSRGLTIVLYEFIGARYERAIALEE